MKIHQSRNCSEFVSPKKKKRWKKRLKIYKNLKMGFKLVCTNCRISFSIGNDYQIEHSKRCRNCGQNAHLLHHKFKPPKKKDKKAWEIVKFLIDHGFDFSSAYVPLVNEK